MRVEALPPHDANRDWMSVGSPFGDNGWRGENLRKPGGLNGPFDVGRFAAPADRIEYLQSFPTPELAQVTSTASPWRFSLTLAGRRCPMTQFKWLLAFGGGLFSTAVAFAPPPRGVMPAHRPAPVMRPPVMRPPMSQPPLRPSMPPPVVRPQNLGNNFKPPLVNQSVVGNRPTTAATNLSLGGHRPTTAGPLLTNPKAPLVSPAVTANKPVTGNANLSLGGHRTGPVKPLVTDPHPTATAARTTAATTNHWSGFHDPVRTAAGISALAAASGKSPAEVSLFLASQGAFNHNHWGWGGWGWGGWGWGGWGWGGWGWGWGGRGWSGFFGFSPFGLFPWGWGGSGFGIGFAYNSGPWSFGLGWGGGFGYSPAIAFVPVFAQSPPVVVGDAVPLENPPLIPQADSTLPPPAPAPPAPNEKPVDEGDTDFAARGQELFLAGKYTEAIKVLRHAVLDDPKNGPLLALTGEALWAAGQYNAAAGAIQQAILATPEADWAAVANRAARLTPNDAVGDLAKALGKDELPELRFLAGWQSFGAGKYQEAAAHLDLLLKKAPDDQVAKKLRDQALKLDEKK
jgi:hypothetical protein